MDGRAWMRVMDLQLQSLSICAVPQPMTETTVVTAKLVPHILFG